MTTAERNRPPAAPSWVVDNSREIPAFFPSAGRLIFGVTHLPAQARAGLVICSSVGAEQVTNYRNEVLLARALARVGVAVQRFHYRGAGHSDDLETTVGSMAEDAIAAAGRLTEVAGVPPSSVVGTRWGALAAASTAEALAANRLVFWEPVIDPRRAFRELFRVKASHELRNWKGQARTFETIQAELEASGQLDVLGYALTRRFYDDALPRSLTRSLGAGRRQILVVRLGSTTSAEAGPAGFKAEAEAVGHDVTLAAVPQAPVWYFVDQSFRGVEHLVRLTVQWLVAA